MNNVLYLVLRRMRFPLVLVIGIYCVTVTGMALMPGVDAAGRPTPGMGLFDAFYVISYTSTTIGFGELPAPWSGPQRIWMTFSIYLTVVGWSYSVVQMIGLLQEPGFQRAMRASRFASRVRRLREPYFIVCGYGETGALVCRGLDRLGRRFVVIDSDPERLQQLHLEEWHGDSPTLTADASQPATLTTAGLLSPHCRGVMALADDDDVNRSIAVAVRLLAPHVPVMARVGDPTQELNLGAFGGDFVANPFELFAEHLVEAVSAPESFRLREILTGLPGDEIPEPHRPPSGHWIMCGYGRFGHRVREQLEQAGLGVTVVDKLHFGEAGVDIEGTGMDSSSLKKAGILTSSGIVAGNSNDLKNLAIALVARELKPSIFIVTRQNQQSNKLLFKSFPDDLTMEPSRIVAREFLSMITTPLLRRFVELLSKQSEDWARELISGLSKLDEGRVPEVWSITIDTAATPAIAECLAEGDWLTAGHLLMDPMDRDVSVPAMVLMVARDDDVTALPQHDYRLRIGDEILLAGATPAIRRMALTMSNPKVLSYVRTGHEGHASWIWRAGAAIGRRRVRSRRESRSPNRGSEPDGK